MTKKIALVTGGTSGIGLSLVKELVENNFYVHFIGTSKEKGKRIESELNTVNNSRCKYIELDLSNLKKVKAFADRFKSEVSQLDILLNVAGVMVPKRQETEEGLEKTFAIGYLSAFLLSRELLPILSKVPHSRIINVSGMPSKVLKPILNFDNLNFMTNYSGMSVAVDTVHAKTVMTEILAEQLKSKNIDVNSFHPGTVKSDLARDLPFLFKLFFKVALIFMSKKSESGVFLSTSNDVKGITGQFFIKKKATPLNFDKKYKDQLWSSTESIVERALISN